MKIITIVVGPLQTNCYLIGDEAHGQCMIIDPGDDISEIITAVEERNWKPLKIIATHAHIDHVGRLKELQQHYNLPFYMGEEDLPILNMLGSQSQMFGLPNSGLPDISAYLHHKQNIPCGSLSFTVLHTPGHSPGSLSLYAPGALFAGDVLFKESIGRTDIIGGNYRQLIQSIQNQLLTLPDETVVYPGHGPTTTIAHEKQFNPFLKNTEGL